MLLQRADESLRHTVALGLPHERGAGRDPEKHQLRLEVATHALGAMIMPASCPRTIQVS